MKKYNELLLHLIEKMRIRSSELITNRATLDDAPRACEMFSKREDGVVKVVMHP
ncbi:MAG TPA: hypothetical protein PLF54_06140 [Deltaproteobacteria bacterium]|nr:hypothetical protein [Deltaproteobacteria bacterium]HQJ08563.1 hypothetical protein [Deltaproteobacteria bacterium]